MANTEFTSEFSTLPYSAEAEQAVLGAIILDSTVFDKVLDHVTSPEFFYIGLHKQIFQQMQDMMNFGTSIDVVTLLDRLKKSGAFDEANGKTYIMDLAENCPSISNAEEYAKIIKEKYQLRLLITASRKTIDEATAGEGETSLLLDSAEQRLFDIRTDSSKTGLERIDSVLFQTFARLDSLNREADDSLRPVPTGIEDLDRMITGLNRSDTFFQI